MASLDDLKSQDVKEKEFTQFCRACACEIKEEACEIKNFAKPDLLLKRYVPEFDIKVEDACLCTDCVSILHIFHNFKRKCLRTEEELRLYVRKHPEVKKVKLNHVFAPDKEQKNNATDDSQISTSSKRTTSTAAREFSCPICRHLFCSEHSLRVHKRKTHGGELYKCEKCGDGRFFSCEKSVQVHKRRFHGRERYQCDKCSREFVFKEKYNEHLEYHKTPVANRFTCKICNFVYHSAGALNKHKLQKHSSNDEKPFQCEVCAKRFVERSGLVTHMRKHTGEKPYKCSFCKYTSAQLSSLYSHVIRKHKVEPKRKCYRGAKAVVEET